MKKLLILGGNSDIGVKIIDKLIVNNRYKLHVHFNKNLPKKNIQKKLNLSKEIYLILTKKILKNILTQTTI